MKELMVKGTQTFLGKEIPVINGGFGEDQKIILTKTVAEIHGFDLKYINRIIKRNIKNFTFGEDILDLKTSDSQSPVLENGLLTKAEWGNAKNVYILSRRGYTKIVAAMDNDNDKKWEVMNKLIDEYFTMEQALKDTIPTLIKRIESLEEQVKILSASPNNYKEFKSLTEWLKGYNIPTSEANKILVELGIMKKDKEGFHLSDYYPTTWGVPKPIQGVLRIYWSAIGFGKIIPKIQKKWDQKKLVSGQYEQAKMEI